MEKCKSAQYFFGTIFLFSTINFFGYKAPSVALVRDISATFQDSLKQHQPATPIDLALAKNQHELYIDALKQSVDTVIRVPAHDQFPDCNFIEDTAIIVDDIAVISHMGAVSRRGEEVAVAQALKDIGFEKIEYVQAPATMDGGDILKVGQYLFVGISQRTNQIALSQLQNIFKNRLQVIGIDVVEGLHLKSVITAFDDQTLIIADNFAGSTVQQQIKSALSEQFNWIVVPDVVASNVLRVGSALFIQQGFPASELILKNLCQEHQLRCIPLCMSELIKADGALTCGCLLID